MQLSVYPTLAHSGSLSFPEKQPAVVRFNRCIPEACRMSEEVLPRICLMHVAAECGGTSLSSVLTRALFPDRPWRKDRRVKILVMKYTPRMREADRIVDHAGMLCNRRWAARMARIVAVLRRLQAPCMNVLPPRRSYEAVEAESDNCIHSATEYRVCLAWVGEHCVPSQPPLDSALVPHSSGRLSRAQLRRRGFWTSAAVLSKVC